MLEHTRAVPPITLDLPEDAISTTTSLMLPKGLTKDQWVAIAERWGNPTRAFGGGC